MENLLKDEYATYFQGYVNLSLQNHYDLYSGMKKSLEAGLFFLKQIPDEKYLYRYEPDKWSIKEVVQHIIDTERILSYRALRFARKDPTELPGFDDAVFTLNSNADRRDFFELILEMEKVRESSIVLYQGFSADSLKYSGMAGGNRFSVRALGHIITGHLLHHLEIIKLRYL